MGAWPTQEESSRRRFQAVALRRQDLSYKQIRALIGGSMSSLSMWLRQLTGGCLVVTIRRSGDLNKQLEGWFDAIASKASTLSTSSAGPIRAAVGVPRA